MMEGFFDVFAILFVTMGPIKVLIVFAEKTAGIAHEIRQRIILKSVTIATVIGLLFIVGGQFLMKLFKFSLGSLTIAGGIILLIFGITMVLSESIHSDRQYTDKEAEDMATYPFALPLMASPMGLVALTVFSANTHIVFTQVVGLIAALLVVMVINLIVLFSVETIVNRIDPQALQIAERILGILLTALAVETIMNGLQTFGVV